VGSSDPDIAVHDSSGNVFDDLGLPADALLKAKIVRVIANAIRSRGLTQTEAGKIIGADQAKVSALVNGRLAGFTLDRLFGFLQALGRDIEINVSEDHPGRRGEIRVREAA
jgi:predicted XRE-type DNA-binding protein